MNKYGLMGKLTAKSGEGIKLAAILLQASHLVSTMKGCRLYIVSIDRQNADSIHIFEVWDSQADHDASLSLPNVRDLIAQAQPLIDGQISAPVILDTIGGAGLSDEKRSRKKLLSKLIR